MLGRVNLIRNSLGKLNLMGSKRGAFVKLSFSNFSDKVEAEVKINYKFTYEKFFLFSTC